MEAMLRYILFALTVLAFPVSAPSTAAEKPYRVSLVGDAYADGGWVTGVRIELADGWKTYWRMPGESGIPPQFAWTSSVPARVEVAYPLPGRHADATGDSIGYADEVIFPVMVQAGEASAVKLDLDLFFGVCRDICIPARATAAIDLGPAIRDAAGSRAVSAWMARVPEAGTPVKQAETGESAGRPVLRLALALAAEDVFVESETAAYFRKPVLSADGTAAELAIDNVRDLKRLEGAALKVTVSAGGRGLEQTVTLP